MGFFVPSFVHLKIGVMQCYRILTLIVDSDVRDSDVRDSDFRDSDVRDSGVRDGHRYCLYCGRHVRRDAWTQRLEYVKVVTVGG